MERRPTDYLSQSHEKNPTSLSAAQSDVEKTMDSVQSANSTVESTRSGHVLRSNPQPFIGRLGGNQEFVLDRSDAANAPILKELPDAAPYMSMREQFDLRPFRSPGLWKAAIVEGVGSFLLVFVTVWTSSSPAVIPQPPTPQMGNFGNAAFIGPLVGGITSWLLITLFIFTFGAVTGAHLNPTITIATFCARLCSLPRAVLYVASQTIGGASAGILVRVAIGTRDFQAGGCWLYPDVVPVSSAWVIEFMSCLTLLFLAFGVGLDPRQRQAIGPSLGPFLVGLSLGVMSFGSGFTRYGYGGASMNPARCFGAFVGSRFPRWHWIHWVADIAACIVHGACYGLIPPWRKYVEV